MKIHIKVALLLLLFFIFTFRYFNAFACSHHIVYECEYFFIYEMCMMSGLLMGAVDERHTLIMDL